jgi:hypothetical protein
VLKGHGQRSDDLVDAMRGIQRGLDEMKLAPANHSVSRSMTSAPNTKFLCQIYERPDPIPPAAGCAADRPGHFHDVCVFAKRIIFAGAGVTRLISS